MKSLSLLVGRTVSILMIKMIIFSEILRDENIAIIAGSVAGVIMLTIVIIISVLKLKKKL